MTEGPESASQDVRVEFDGEGVEPETVDSRTTLELASAYFDLLARVAQHRGTEIRLTGLRVLNKCVAVATSPSSFQAAQEAAAEVDDYLLGREEPAVAILAFRRLLQARRALPVGYEAKIIIGPWTRPLSQRAEIDAGPSPSSISLRARPLRAGGVKPKVRFESDSEDFEFTLDVSEDQARDLGAHLYREVDIAATVWRDRDRDRVIRRGRLDDFFPLEDDHPGARGAIRSWLHENASEWNDFDDIEAELKRE